MSNRDNSLGNTLDNSLGKHERLCGRSATSALFKSSNGLFHYPFRCVWSFVDCEAAPSSENGGVKVLFSVPKKRVRKANKRNLLKRRMKESYRLNKHPLLSSVLEDRVAINMALMYVSSDILDYHKIEDAIKVLLSEVKNAYK